MDEAVSAVELNKKLLGVELDEVIYLKHQLFIVNQYILCKRNSSTHVTTQQQIDNKSWSSRSQQSVNHGFKPVTKWSISLFTMGNTGPC